jgi:hypothetical protein
MRTGGSVSAPGRASDGRGDSGYAARGVLQCGGAGGGGRMVSVSAGRVGGIRVERGTGLAATTGTALGHEQTAVCEVEWAEMEDIRAACVKQGIRMIERGKVI